MWVDVTMFTLTEVIWVAVIENVIAQVVNAYHSPIIAKLIDYGARCAVPPTTFVCLCILFIFGRMDPDTLMVLVQAVFVGGVGGYLLIICCFLMCQQHVIVRYIVREMWNKKLLKRDGIQVN